jgi:hypothetical protein
MASGRDLRRDEIARQRDGAGARDRAPGRLGEVARRVNARELRRLEQRVAERGDLRAAFGARAVVILAPDRDPAQVVCPDVPGMSRCSRRSGAPASETVVISWPVTRGSCCLPCTR